MTLPWRIGGVAALLVTGVIWWSPWRTLSVGAGRPAVVTLKRAPLTIKLSADGSLEANKSNRLLVPQSRRGSVYVQMKLKWIVPEGTRVNAGEKVCELDAPELLQQLQLAQSSADQAKAQLASYQEEIKLLESEGRSKISSANLALQEAQEKLQVFYELDSKKKLRELEQRIDEARAALDKAKDDLQQANAETQSNPFVDEAEEKAMKQRLETARAGVKKSQKLFETASAEQKTYKKYDFRRELARLEKLLEDAKLNYQKVKIGTDVALNAKRSQMIQSQTTWESQTRQVEALKEFQKEMVMVSPTDGIVSLDREGLTRYGLQNMAMGQSVHPGMPLLLIPDLSAWVVRCAVEEAYRSQLREGQAVTVEMVALPGETFTGTIRSIGAVGRPRDAGDAASPKVYDVFVALAQRHPQFMQGMSARAEIFVEEIPQALAVPLEAVSRDEKGKAFVMVETPEGPRRTPVTTGKSNEQFVALLKGVNEGDRVFVVPPTDAP